MYFCCCLLTVRLHHSVTVSLTAIAFNIFRRRSFEDHQSCNMTHRCKMTLLNFFAFFFTGAPCASCPYMFSMSARREQTSLAPFPNFLFFKSRCPPHAIVQIVQIFNTHPFILLLYFISRHRRNSNSARPLLSLGRYLDYSFYRDVFHSSARGCESRGHYVGASHDVPYRPSVYLHLWHHTWVSMDYTECRYPGTVADLKEYRLAVNDDDRDVIVAFCQNNRLLLRQDVINDWCKSWELL